MPYSALELKEYVNGELEGNPDVIVHRPSKIEDAGEGSVTFLANKKYEDWLTENKASVIIIDKDYKIRADTEHTYIKVKDPYHSFTRILELFEKKNKLKGIDKSAYIDQTAAVSDEGVYVGAFSFIGKKVVIGKDVMIYPQVYIGDNSVIENGSIIYPGVKIYNSCKVGKNCIIHANTVIGSDGFGFAAKEDQSYEKIPQLGNVIIGDDVEIGAGCTIDRATMGSTIIGEGVKLDNLIQVAHNAEIGSFTVIAAQAGVSGSTKLGSYCVVGGQAGFVGHIEVADGAKVNAQSGVSKSIKSKGVAVTGSPAWKYNDALRSQAVFRNLPELEKRIRQLEEKLKNIENI